VTPGRTEAGALPIGSRLAEFEIERVLGAGGFGIVYLALDHSLGRHVAIKEYVPSSLAARAAGPTLTVRSAANAPTFESGLRSFINEARLLASFDHPSLVKVHRFWEANGTAYMAMPYYAGRTLKEVRSTLTQPPDEAWLRGLIDPLLGALEVLHAQRVYHRDISPDNIMLLPDGRPVLLDFGSARRVLGDASNALTAILKPHFAPIEQYADLDSFPQGAWTDLYALGAVVYFMLRGHPPVPAAVRSMHDEMPALSNGSSRFLAAIDWMLAVHPKDRPQSIAALRKALNAETAPPRDAATPPHPAAATRAAVAVAAHALCSAAFATRSFSQREASSGASASVSPAAAPVAAPAPVAAADASGSAPRGALVATLASKPPKTRALQASPPRPAASTAAPPAHDECAGKNFVMRAICLRAACETPQRKSDPQCVKLRADEEARDRAAMTR
jgi:serine/threonine protein kinase